MCILFNWVDPVMCFIRTYLPNYIAITFNFWNILKWNNRTSLSPKRRVPTSPSEMATTKKSMKTMLPTGWRSLECSSFSTSSTHFIGGPTSSSSSTPPRPAPSTTFAFSVSPLLLSLWCSGEDQRWTPSQSPINSTLKRSPKKSKDKPKKPPRLPPSLLTNKQELAPWTE